MARIVRDAAGNIVTDPAILEQILGVDAVASAARSKPVKVPATVDVTPKMSVQAADESATGEAKGGGVMQFARDVLSGEAIAKAPKAIGEAVGLIDPADGADKVRGLEDARRYRGSTPEYRDLGTSWPGQAIQLASNVAADAIGTVASKVSLPVEVGVQGWRSAAEVGAGALTDVAVKARKFGLDSPSNWLFGELSAKALEKEQLRGKYRTADALERRAEGVGEFLKGAAFGLSPAVYAAAEASARGEDVTDAAWETFKAYPLASVIPFAHLGRTMTSGTTHAVSGGEKLHTPRGEPVMVNALGQKIIDKTGPMTQRLAFDVVPTERVKQIRTTGQANLAMETKSPAAENLAQAVTQYNVLRDLEAELADPKFAGATEWQKFQAVEGTLGGKGPQQAPVLDAGARGKAQSLGESLVLDGMDPLVAQQAVPYVLFEGVRAAKAGMMGDPLQALGDFSAHLAQMQPAQRGQFVKSFEQVVKQKLNDPAFLAAADQAWSSPKGDLQWIPRSEVRQRAGYVEAYNRIKAGEQAASRQVFDLHIPELGELKKDYAYNLYSTLVDDLRSSPEGRDRVLNLLRSNPVARVGANPHASIPEQALATWANQPGGVRRRFVDAINKASLEVSENLGVDPLVVAKNFDRYLSRSFRDALDGNDKLLEMLNAMEGNPARASAKGFEKQGGRYKRKLGDKGAGTDFMDRVAKGEIDLNAALATTSASMIALSQTMHAMSELEGVLRQNGAAFDPLPNGQSPKPGLVFTGTAKAAPAGQRASSDPYNFVLGKMANKWVDPAVAQALHLQVEGIASAHPAMQMWRWLRTVANVTKYQFTQLINDNTMMWGMVGESRFTRRGRQLALEAQAGIERYAAGLAQPGPQQRLVLTPEMRAAQAYGVTNLDGVAMELETLPASVRGFVLKQAMVLGNQVIKAADPADAMGVMAQTVMHLKTAQKMPKQVLEAILSMPEAYRSADDSNATTGVGRKWVRATSAFAAANDVLTHSVLSTATAMAEQQRRMQAFLFGKRLLGLSDEKAAILASESVYGIEPSSVAMRRFVTNPISQILAPPFINFGVWQLKKTTQRALNDKALWIGHALEQGVRAYEEEMQDNQGDEAWQARLTDAMLKHSVAPDVGLSSADDLADALKTMGVSPNMVEMVRGKEGRNPYLALSLRDIGGYQSAFSNINLDTKGPYGGLIAAFQFNPFAQTAAQLLDPQMSNPYKFGSGIPVGSGDTMARVGNVLQLGFSLLAPTAVSKTADFIADTATLAMGEQPMKYGGSPKNPIEVATSMWGPFALNAVDKMEVVERADRRAKFYSSTMKAQHARDMKEMENDRSIPDDMKGALLNSTDVNAKALIDQMGLGMSWAYLGMSLQEYRKHAREIETYRREANAEIDKGLPTGSVVAKWAQTGPLAKWTRLGQQLLALVAGDMDKGAE
jgi:hypothetical protein